MAESMRNVEAMFSGGANMCYSIGGDWGGVEGGAEVQEEIEGSGKVTSVHRHV